MRTPIWARVLLYGFFGLVLAFVLTKAIGHVVPGRWGVTISRNSEGFLILLAVCGWIDVVRPRLRGSRVEWPVTIVVGAGVTVAGFLLRGAPWPSRIVTLNEALIAIGVLVVYLQLSRPVARWTLAVPLVGLVWPVVGWGSPFTTDMAEAFGAMVLIPLVVDVVDRGLLRGEPAHRARNILWAVGLLVFIVGIHLVTPKHPEGVVENATFYVQRATEVFLAAGVILVYYAARRRAVMPQTAADDSLVHA